MNIDPNNRLSEEDYFKSRMKGRLYLSKQFDDKFTGKKKRYAQKITESEVEEKFIKVKDEILLSTYHGGRYQLKALLIEDNRSIESLVIQSFTEETGSPHKEAFSFKGGEVENLYLFLKGIKEIPIQNLDSLKVEDKNIQSLNDYQNNIQNFVNSNQEIVLEIVKNKITNIDIISLGYRKKQLERFDKLLTDNLFFEEEKARLQISDETIWQNFFEENTWILGYGLNYIFNTPLNGKKLEQVVSGYNISNHGKRADALLKSRGVINSLCFGEIKTHKTKLLKHNKEPYRPESWAVSDELTGGIVQSHRTVQYSLKSLHTKIEFKDNEDNITGEHAYLYKPKSFLLIGSLSEFVGENGINEMKFSSFEMFRRSLQSPEIITFDELYERAVFIVNNQAFT